MEKYRIIEQTNPSETYVLYRPNVRIDFYKIAVYPFIGPTAIENARKAIKEHALTHGGPVESHHSSYDEHGNLTYLR